MGTKKKVAACKHEDVVPVEVMTGEGIETVSEECTQCHQHRAVGEDEWK